MKRSFLLLLISTIVCWGCDSFKDEFPKNTMHLVLDSLRKGMPQRDVRRILSKEFKLETSFDLVDGSRTYRVDQYWITSIRYRSLIMTGMSYGTNQTSDIYREVGMQFPMLVMYDDGALRFWGTLEDYELTEDGDVARLSSSLDEEVTRAR